MFDHQRTVDLNARKANTDLVVTTLAIAHAVRTHTHTHAIGFVSQLIYMQYEHDFLKQKLSIVVIKHGIYYNT